MQRSPVQLAVAGLVARGLINREVAERLCISPQTASGHLRHAFEKLGINSHVALTRIAAGLIALDERVSARDPADSRRPDAVI